MPSIHQLLTMLDEQTIARAVQIPHDNARISYPLARNTAADYVDFERVIGDYYNHHFCSCVARGGELPQFEAIGRAKRILESEYRRRNLTINNAIADAKEGTNGGLSTILNTIADALKSESVEQYIEDVFDRHVAGDSWEQRVEIMRQLLAHFGDVLPHAVRSQPPERYAQDYKDFIRYYADALRQTAARLRRM
jgi:hypothetical protein